MKNTERKLFGRLVSARGTVMVEFAFTLPVLLMMGMFFIEMVQYHDAQIMADHAAWRIARIAAVRTSGDKASVKFPTVAKKASAEKLAAAMLMTTVTAGNLQDTSFASVVKNMLGDKIGISEYLIKLLGLDRILDGFFDVLPDVTKGRFSRQLGNATYKILAEKDLIKVETESVGKLAYPVISTNSKKEPEPVNGHLVKVKFKFPMRDGWLFKYFAMDPDLENKRPYVHGRAAMLACRRIENPSVYALKADDIPWDIEVIWAVFRDKIFKIVNKK